MHTILIMLSQGETYPFSDSRCRVPWNNFSNARHDRHAMGVQLVIQAGTGPQRAGEREDVSAFPQHLGTIEDRRS